jgi:mono/diheme cytochrome c family protein
VTSHREIEKSGKRGQTMLRFFLSTFPLWLLVGCQQRMAEQPGHRGYEASEFFPNQQGVRPLEPGTVYRGQRAAIHPMLTGLSLEGQKVRNQAANEDNSDTPELGAPDRVENYVTEFPFEMTEADLKRGQQRYNIFCAVCHGATGDGNGKIVERGYLRPPSYHTDPEGRLIDSAATGIVKAEGESQLPKGYSRGFDRFGIRIPIHEVPVGYIFQVITQGYGGMPDHASQIPPEDRWRIVAYIRALQLSQRATIGDLPPDVRKAAEEAMAKPATKTDEKR